MSVRTTIANVTFDRTFWIDGYDGLFQPGVYAVETDEQLLDGLSFAAYVRVRTALHLHRTERRSGDSRTVIVSGLAFDDALDRDRAAGAAASQAAPSDR